MGYFSRIRNFKKRKDIQRTLHNGQVPFRLQLSFMQAYGAYLRAGRG